MDQVDVAKCVAEHLSRWKNPESFGFVLSNPQRLPFIQIRGRPVLFGVPLHPETHLIAKPTVEVQSLIEISC